MSTLHLPNAVVPDASMPPSLAVRLSPVFLWAAAGFAFALSWRVSASSVMLGLMLIVAMTQAIVQGRTLRLDFDRRVLWACGAYLLWMLVSVAWSDNQEQAWWDIRKQVALVLVPLAFAVQPPQVDKRKATAWILTAMALGVFSTMPYLLWKAYARYQDSGMPQEFFSTALANPLSAWHTDYARMLAIACVYFLWVLWQQWRNLAGWQRALLLLAQLAGGAVQFLLASKLLLVFHFAAIFVLLVYLLWQAGFRKTVPVIGLVLAAGAIMVGTRVESVAERFTRMGQVGTEMLAINMYDPCVDQYDELTLRLILWKNALINIERAPVLGHGIGDAMKVTGQQMRRVNFWPNFHEVNVHNQYLQTTLGMGLIGLGLLLVLFAVWSIRAWRSRNVVLLTVVVLLWANSLFDATLTMYNVFNVFVFLLALGVWTAQEASLQARTRAAA